MACFRIEQDLPKCAHIPRRCCKTAPVNAPAAILAGRASRSIASKLSGGGRWSMPVSDQTALSFANQKRTRRRRRRGVCRGGAEAYPAAQDLDKKSKGLLAKAAEITGFKGKKDHDRRSHRAARTEIRETRARRHRQDRVLRPGGLAQSRRHRAGTPHRQGGADRAYLPRERRRQGHRRRRRKLCARRTAARLQVQEVQDQAEEEKRCGAPRRTTVR